MILRIRIASPRPSPSAILALGIGLGLGLLTPTAFSGAVQGVRGGRLVAALGSEPKHLNPLTAVDGATKTVLSLVMADLVRIDRDTQQSVSNLARGWSVSEDGRRYTVELRDGVRFSDGHPLDADDVVFTFEAYADEGVRSPQRDLLIVGGEPIRVEKIDERRVAFHLAEPYAAGERLFDSFYILPQHVLGPLLDRGELATAWSDFSSPTSAVGLGPFRVQEVVPGERVVLTRNPHYWKRDAAGGRLPYLEEIVLQILPSEEAAVLRFRSGALHVLERVSPRAFVELSRAAGRSGYRVADLGAGLEYSFLFFNLNDTGGDRPEAAKRAWFRNPEFRRAIAAAVDREGIARLVYLGKASPLDTHVSPGDRLWRDPEVRAPSYSLERARERLSAAGFRWTADERLVDADGRPVKLSILTSASSEARKRMASILQEDLRRLGIDARIAELEFRAYVDRIFESRDYELGLMALASGDVDPNPAMSFLLSDGGMHVWRLGASRDPAPWQAEIDRLMTEQLTALDRDRRRKLYFGVQRLLADELPFIGIVSPHVLVGADRRLRNFRPGILTPYTLWNAEELYFGDADPE